MSKSTQRLTYIFIVFAALGVLDAAYLTYEHYAGIVPPCSIHWWLTDCGQVLGSKYSMLFGIVPLALTGVFQYLTELTIAIYFTVTGNVLAKKLLLLFSSVGLLFSIYFVYLMIFVIQAICLYCFASAIISLVLFLVSAIVYGKR